MDNVPHSDERPPRSPAMQRCVEDEVLEWYRLSPRRALGREYAALGYPSSCSEASLSQSPIPRVLSTMRTHGVALFFAT